jgi:hypothetical protein
MKRALTPVSFFEHVRTGWQFQIQAALAIKIA